MEQLAGNTIYGNTGHLEGGGLYLDEGADLADDTIYANSSRQGGDIYDTSEIEAIENTIVAGGSSDDCYDGTLSAADDHGHNLDSDGTCFGSGSPLAPIASTDKIDVNPKLGSLAFNGGPLETVALLSGSPAIGAGACSLGITTDERGVTLPSSGCDIGAYQVADSNLGVRISHGKVRAGRRLRLTFKITNAGPGPGTAVALKMKLPTGVKLVSAHASQGTCSGEKTVACSLGAINSSQTGSVDTATVTLVVVPRAARSLKVSGSVSSSSPDPSKGNNKATTKI